MVRSSSFRKMLVGLSFLGMTATVAIVGYVLAGWTVVDALYMFVITVFGVGYGEVHPVESAPMKLFTIVVVIAGCSSGIYVVGGFVQMIAEGEIHKALGARRMSRGVQKLTNHVIVCGFGRVGQILAEELKQHDIPFVCIDRGKERIQEAEEKGYLAVLGNAGDEETLRQAGVERARAIAPVLPDDAANVFITLTAREFRSDVLIIARGESGATQRKLIRSGADHVVLPAAIGASRIANLIACPSAEKLLADTQQRQRLNADFATLGLALREVRIEENTVFAQRRVADVELETTGKAIVVAIRSPDGALRRNPDPNDTVNPGDTLFIVASNQQIHAVVKDVQHHRGEMVYRGAKA